MKVTITNAGGNFGSFLNYDQQHRIRMLMRPGGINLRIITTNQRIGYTKLDLAADFSDNDVLVAGGVAAGGEITLGFDTIKDILEEFKLASETADSDIILQMF